MKKLILTLLVMVSAALTAMAGTDIIVMNDGTVINAYNLDYSSKDKCYYSLDEAGEQMKFVNKNDVMIIKLADGTKIDPAAAPEAKKEAVAENAKPQAKNPGEHAPVTHNAIEPDFVELQLPKYKKGGGTIFKYELPERTEKQILVSDGKDQVLNMRLIDADKKLLAVTRPRYIEEKKKDKIKYKETYYKMPDCVIPEYVMVGNDKYTVTEIDPYAFLHDVKLGGLVVTTKKIIDPLNSIVFPSTLEKIGTASFMENSLGKLILPESLKEIGDGAFYTAGGTDFSELYIPKGIEKIGKYSFQFLGPNTSYRGYYQGYISSMPDFITVGNCNTYGIDEEAVEAYEKKNR